MDRRRLPALLTTASLVLLAGCVSIERLPAPPGKLSTALPLGFDAPVRFAYDSPDSFRQHSAQNLQRMKAAAGDGPINILALSGGGGGGNGALVGWSRSGRRPEFSSSASASARCAARLPRPGRDAQLTEALTGDSSSDLLPATHRPDARQAGDTAASR